jgi:tetratricopeptide (TPR) repeat protein
MAHLRRLLAYAVCVAIATPPFAYGQNTAVPTPKTTPQPPAMTGVTLSGSQQATFARLMIAWPKATTGSATAAVGSGLMLIRLPRAVDVDPMIFARSAPNFIGGAALSSDKRTIRLALVQGARVVEGRDGDTQSFDLVLADAPDPEPFSIARQQAATAQQNQNRAAETNAPPPKLVNGPAPEGAPRVSVETAVSKEFTRLRLTNSTPGGTLPNHGYARRGDRLAISVAGTYGLDVAQLRSQLPARVVDAVRYNSPTDTALVLDVAPGSVVRHSREGNSILLDILPAGSDPNSVNALIAQAAANVGAPSPERAAVTPPPAAAAGTAAPGPAPTPEQTATGLTRPEAGAPAEQNRPDPAPSGRVMVTPATQGTNAVLEFGFEAPAPAVVFRRGDSIYALFATKAQFDVSKIKVSPAVSSISQVAGEGVAGVRIVVPPQFVAQPSALGGIWRLALTPAKMDAARTITIEREQAADGTGRLKALVPDAAATGRFVDPVVGDDVILGLALGPASPVAATRSFLEASLPETFHGLVVTPRAEDLDLRRSAEGFVLVRPTGMALSAPDDVASAEGFASVSPGFIDHKAWRLGPTADFTKNLSRLRKAAAGESGMANAGVQKRLDLARFLLAWDLGPEAAGVLSELERAIPAMDRVPEFVALEGISRVLMNRGKEGLELLSQPEVEADPAAQLWAGLAAQQQGNAEEALLRFERGASALAKFWPEQQAIFLLAKAQAALATGNNELAGNLAGRALDVATGHQTKARAQFVGACALAKSGELEKALAAFTELERAGDREIAARSSLQKAVLGLESGKSTLPDTIGALDALRYAWRGDDLEIDVLRRLGALYIQGGDIRSGLTTMASGTSLRPDLPAARLLRDELFNQFKYLFLEGGADGMPPVQALALFYDFKDLAPIGPDGDRMVRGLADRLVALDLLPQATQLLQHQVDKRLEGFAKAQVATDLAAIYLMDHRAEPALKAIWNSRITMLPEALNAQRRLIEAAALAELGRTEHALEIIEFDTGPDASRLRAELHMRGGDWPKASANARATLPSVKASFEPEEAGEVLRAAIAASMAGEQDNVRALVANHGAAMGKSAYAEAFKVVTDPAIPDPAALQAAMASVTGGSPYHGLMKRLRNRLSQIEGPPLAMAVPDGPTDGDPRGFVRDTAPLVPEVQPEMAGEVGAPTNEIAAQPAVPETPIAAEAAPAQTAPAPAVARAKTAPPVRRSPPPPVKAARREPAAQPQQTKAKAPPSRRALEAPRDPPPAPVTAR